MKNRRTAALLLLIFAAAALCAVAAGGAVLGDRAVVSDFSRKNLPPCPALLFGADWLVPASSRQRSACFSTSSFRSSDAW